MNIITIFGDFLLDTWLWNMTWGWNQLSLAFVFMWILVVFIGRLKSVPALILTISSYCFAFVSFSIVVIGVVIYFFQWEYVAKTTDFTPINVLHASISLAVVYTILQSIFYFAINRWYNIAHPWVFIVIITSNAIAAALAIFFIQFSS